MMRWLLVLTIVVVLIFVGALVAALRMFCRPAQIALRRELRGEIPTSVYPMDVKRVPPPSLPQRGIPKQIFRTWEDDSWKTKCRKAYDHTAKIVPDWPQKVYTSEQRRQFVHKVYADYPDIIDAYELCNYGVMECDMWRHLVIYHYGGLYLDMKSGVLDPIDLDLNVDKAYVGLWNNMNHTYLFKGGEYQNWWVLAPPKCQFLWKLIWQIVRNILHLRDHGEQDIPFFDVSMYGKYHNKTRVMATGGPLVYSYIAHKYPYTVTSIGHVSNKYFEFCRLAGSEYNQKAKTHYSQQTKPLLKPHVVKAQLSRPLKLGKVPKVLHMTYINKESVPQFVWDNLKQYTQGYDLRFYSDEDCDFYLWKHYGPQVLEAWYMQAKGAHKADLFRYAVLAREGGVYLDIKVDVRKPLGQMFDHSIPFTSVETRFPNKRNIHNGILSAAPHHPVLYNALDFACKGDKRKNMEYHVNIDYLHKLLRREVDGQHLRIGRNDGRRGSFVLHEEKLKKGNDRYGWDNSIVNAQGTVLAKTRYHSYGSWNKQPSPLVEIKNYTTKVRLSHKIPNNIFQNHKRRMVPAGMANAIRKIQDHGSNYSYTFYDDETSRQYIAKHHPSALEAFDTLIPGAYKSDLFRIIRLYVEGGVYFDAPFSPYDSTLKLDQLLKPTDTFVSANDRGHGLYNAFMASVPKHPILKVGIDSILNNVQMRNYTSDMLGVTGPHLYNVVFSKLQLGACCSGIFKNGIRFFEHPGKKILLQNRQLYNTRYNTYQLDRETFWKDSPHYSTLWKNRCVFEKQHYNTSRQTIVWSDGMSSFAQKNPKMDVISKYTKGLHLPKDVILINMADKTFPIDYNPIVVENVYNIYTKVLAQNLDRSRLNKQMSKKTIAIPIGIDLHTVQEKGGWGSKKTPWRKQLDQLYRLRNKNVPRMSKVLVTWTKNSNTSERHVKNGYKSRPQLWREAMSNPDVFELGTGNRDHTWKMMSEYAFVYSPIGMGFDCHRTWEALALGCIVIAQPNPTIKEFVDRYPIILHNDPAKITQQDLRRWLHMYKPAKLEDLTIGTFLK